jgi:hypothetical protein
VYQSLIVVIAGQFTLQRELMEEIEALKRDGSSWVPKRSREPPEMKNLISRVLEPSTNPSTLAEIQVDFMQAINMHHNEGMS